MFKTETHCCGCAQSECGCGTGSRCCKLSLSAMLGSTVNCNAFEANRNGGLSESCVACRRFRRIESTVCPVSNAGHDLQALQTTHTSKYGKDASCKECRARYKFLSDPCP